jgi:hypothetical protein
MCVQADLSASPSRQALIAAEEPFIGYKGVYSGFEGA